VAQDEGSEFKPQYCKKKKREKEREKKRDRKKKKNTLKKIVF
jgi:hypothetical protein